MKPSNWHNRIYRSVRSLKFLVLAALCVLGPLGQVQPDPSQPVQWQLLIGWAQNHSWWVLPLAIVVGACDFILGYMGAPKLWKSVQTFLDTFQKHIFRDVPTGLVHNKRVTLFRYSKWQFLCGKWRRGRWPWSGWLSPCARSGHTTQCSNTVFLAPDNGNAEGIAGLVWASNLPQFISIPNVLKEAYLDSQKCLPQERQKYEKDLAKAISDYAKNGNVSDEWVRARLKHNKLCARWFCGIPIEVNNKLWGVIVIDSVEPVNLSKEEILKDFSLMARFLANILEAI